jgi:hypothetical protein
MRGDNGLRKWVVPPHDDMAAVLAAHSEAQSPGRQALAPDCRDQR